uniref:DNA topoisomerase (ATP-hydrolyzing) n=1 Tax=viral metagenome TaxID=1070528 RepID=A0A6C0IAT1_9ZZZZ
MSAAKKVEDKYKKYELLEHILALPDTYIGSIEPQKITSYIYDEETKKMVADELTYIPGLLKIFDEVIVNAIDHCMRLRADEEKGKEDIKHVKNIKVTIDKATGRITIMNDGNGVDIKKHSSYGDLWIPELIFGELLTSTNYDKGEEKIWGGKNGYGSKLTNIFSKEFSIETIDHYTKKIYTQTFSNNMTARTIAEVKASSKVPYTQISFIPDYERFGMKNMSDDIYKLFNRRVIDACATTPKEVSVYFNGEKLMIKDFEKYCELFLDKKEQPFVYEAVGERWEVVASISSSGSFEFLSFVNGINTIKGGKHIEYITNMITKNLVDMTLSKKKKAVKAQHIKDNLFVFVKALIVNPSFDSQSKETLTTPVAKFGSKCELSEKFYDKLFKIGIVDKALSITEFYDKKKLVKTDGKKISRIIVPKLDDANLAGTKDSAACTLILTEGDSAKTMAVAGLSIIGRDKYGVFPLRGKILNVKDATLQKITDNTEITAIKKILGLEQNKKYTDLSQLRYGSIMIMTDQDHDGSHIKGLIFNIFQSMWHELYEISGFLTSMLTPIIKATNSRGNEIIEFYNMSDYERWGETDVAKNGSWKIKYYKGLGTSNDQEAKEYFKNMKKITYKYDKDADEVIDLAFNKKRADDRKEWLANYDKDNVLDYTNLEVDFKTFVDKDLIHFSNRDLQRSINHICDGLKESTRKILFACFKRKLYTNEVKVAQLSGYVSEVSAYHHGENSLQQAIVGMAQIYVGTNNINLLSPNGQFGSRCQGGQDASSARYIFTLLTKLTKLIFKEEDNNTLTYQDDDGQQIEPEFYIPVIPMILVNGGIGIGTGYSTNIPQFNPSEIIAACKFICTAIKLAGLDGDTEDGMDNIYETIDILDIDDLVPYYLGFNGTIKKSENNSYISKGIYKWIDGETLEITELPIGMWTEDYKEFLENMITNGLNNLKYIENHYTSKNVKFILHFNANVRETFEDKFEQLFKMSSSKNLSINNIHLFNKNGAIQKYDNTTEIIKEWSKTRILKYIERKAYQIKILEKDFLLLSAKIRFIIDVISGNIQIMNKKLTDIAKRLIELKYPRINTDTGANIVVAGNIDNDASDDVSSDGRDSSDATDGNKDIKDFNYLLKMPISQLTYDRKIILEKEVDALNTNLKNLRDSRIEDLWMSDLVELENAWEEHRDIVLKEYDNDRKGIIEPKKAAKKKAKK